MKTLKINETEALKLYSTASKEFKQILEDSFGKDYFNQKITDKVYDIDSLCEYLGIDENELYIFSKNTEDKHKRFINACNIIPKIVEVYNEGVILDWNNTNQYKYAPYKYLSHGSWLVDSATWASYVRCSVGFCYKSNELSNLGYENFKDVYDDYFGHK